MVLDHTIFLAIITYTKESLDMEDNMVKVLSEMQ